VRKSNYHTTTEATSLNSGFVVFFTPISSHKIYQWIHDDHVRSFPPLVLFSISTPSRRSPFLRKTSQPFIQHYLATDLSQRRITNSVQIMIVDIQRQRCVCVCVCIHCCLNPFGSNYVVILNLSTWHVYLRSEVRSGAQWVQLRGAVSRRQETLPQYSPAVFYVQYRKNSVQRLAGCDLHCVGAAPLVRLDTLPQTLPPPKLLLSATTTPSTHSRGPTALFQPRCFPDNLLPPAVRSCTSTTYNDK
jgi:hypothetical protein